MISSGVNLTCQKHTVVVHGLSVGLYRGQYCEMYMYANFDRLNTPLYH